MALGTPVAAAAAYNATAGGTTVSPAYPAGILATDIVLLFVGQKPNAANGGTVTTPTGWTLRDELTAAGGYGTTLAADSGNTNLRVYSWNTPVAGQTGNLAVTLAANDISWAFMVRVPKGSGNPLYGSADGQRTTAPTVNVAFGTALTNGASATAFQTGDVAIWAMCIPSDVTTPAQFSAQSITATGATFSAATELNEPDSGTGNDIGGYSAWASVTAGSSSTAPTVTVTAAGTVTNVRGPIVLLRLREDALPTITGTLSVTETGADSFTGAGDVLVQGNASFTDAGDDTFTASGSVTNSAVTGDLAAVESGSDAFAATGLVTNAPITGDLAATETDTDSFAAFGDVIVQGALSAIDAGADTLAGTGNVIVQGALSSVEAGSDTFSATGGVASTGALAATEAGADTLSATGGVLVQGALAATDEGADQFNGAGGSFISGALSAEEVGSDAFAADGSVTVQGDLSASDVDGDTLTGDGTVLVQGDLEATEQGSDAAELAGVVLVAGTLEAQETGFDSFEGIGAESTSGSADIVEDLQDLFAGQGAVLVTGTAAIVEVLQDTLQADGVIPAVGALSATEAESDTFAASGGKLASGDLSVVDAPDTASGSGQVIVTGYSVAYETGADVAASPAGYWEYFADPGYAVDDEVGRVLVQGVASILDLVSDSAQATGQIFVRGVASAVEQTADTMKGGIVLGFALSGRTQSRNEAQQSRPVNFESSREPVVSATRGDDPRSRPAKYSASR